MKSKNPISRNRNPYLFILFGGFGFHLPASLQIVFKLLFKVGCVFRIVVVSILFHPESGSNDHREDALHFIFQRLKSKIRLKSFLSVSALSISSFNFEMKSSVNIGIRKTSCANSSMWLCRSSGLAFT